MHWGNVLVNIQPETPTSSKQVHAAITDFNCSISIFRSYMRIITNAEYITKKMPSNMSSFVFTV